MSNLQTGTVCIGGIAVGGKHPLALIAGPCQIESRDHALAIAEQVALFASDLAIPYIFKSSFDKANRSSISGIRGVGMTKGLEILSDLRDRVGCPVISDVHAPDQCVPAGEVLDAVQVPAFLSRQTDLLVAAGKTGRPVMVKKGQFLAPSDMINVAQKIASTGNRNILLCERGACFGYNALVADMRSLSVLAETGYPVVFDATHSVQAPGALGKESGGNRKFAPLLARAAVAAGIDAIFLEVHEDPDRAPSDGAVMLPLWELPPLLRTLRSIDRATREPS